MPKTGFVNARDGWTMEYNLRDDPQWTIVYRPDGTRHSKTEGTITEADMAWYRRVFLARHAEQQLELDL